MEGNTGHAMHNDLVSSQDVFSMYKEAVLIHLNLKCEILFHVLDDHDKVGKLDSQGFLGIWKNLKYQLYNPPGKLIITCWTSDICGGNVGADNFKHKTLNVLICDPFDVAISNLNKN